MATTIGKIITCKSAVVKEFKKPVIIETLQVAVPQAKEVRIKMVAAGLCHSDIVWLSGKVPDQPLPFVLGHEGGGIVESVGDDVYSLKPGDKVLTIFMAQCRKCKICLGDRSNLCEESWGKAPGNTLSRHYGYDGKPRFSMQGKPVYHLAGTSSFSEYVVVPENSCVKINPKAPLEKVCLLSCGFSTGYGSAVNVIDVKPFDTVGIWGLGGVGLAAVVGCKEKNAKQIIGIDINNNREEIGRKLGITDFINPNQLTESLVQVIQEKTKGGLDFAIVCVGDSAAMETAVACTNVGGTMVLVGLGDHTPMKIIPTFLFFSRKIKGTVIGDYNILDDLPKLVDHYLEGKLPLDDLITHHFDLHQINEAIMLMESGKSIRSVIKL